MKKTMNGNYDWRLTLMKQCYLTVTNTLIPTWTPTPTADMIEASAAVGCASGSYIHISSRPQNIWNSGIVHLCLEVPVASRYKRHLM